jgi:thiamine-phosphate pyrophosphorylase
MSPRPKKAEPRPQPRLYLVTPPVEDAAALAPMLADALEAGDVAAVLLRLAPGDERTLINRAKALSGIVQDRNVALLLEGYIDLVAKSGADGAHVSGLGEFNDALRIKSDRIVGAGRLETRHDAMSVAELGGDYVMFGEPDTHGERPTFDAIEERIAWWAEVFEAPCVGFAMSAEEVEPLAKAGADFIALGDWIWRDPANVTAIVAEAARHMHVTETAE